MAKHGLEIVIMSETEVRAEFRRMIKEDKTFAECWPDTDNNFYEWCSNYVDYKHIKAKDNE